MPSETDGRLHRITERTIKVADPSPTVAHPDWKRNVNGEQIQILMIVEHFEGWYEVRNGVRHEAGHNYSVTVSGPAVGGSAEDWASVRYSDGIGGRRLERLPDMILNLYLTGREAMSR